MEDSVKKNKKIPHLRFPKYDDVVRGTSRVRDVATVGLEWEEKRLGDVFRITAGSSKSEYINDDGKNIIVDMGGVSSGGKLIAKKRTRHSDDFLKKDDLVMPKDDIGGGFIIGRVARIPENEKYILGDHVFRLSVKEGISSFYHHAINTFQTNKEFRKKSNGTAQLGLSKKEVENQSVFSPSIPEQKKIAGFLGAVDEWIGILREEKTALETYKRGVMQKLFSSPPARGGVASLRVEGVGDFRFRDDNGNDFPDWEETRLNDLSTFLRGRGIAREDVVEGGKARCVRYGELYTLYGEVIQAAISKTNVKEKDSFVGKKNDILIPSSGETAIDIARASCLLDDGVLLGGDLNILRFKGKQNGIFFAYYFTNALKKNIAKFAQGNSVVHLHASHLKKVKFLVPSFPEQNKIADFLTALDEIITAKDDEITNAEEWKKGLMQKMFV